MANDVIVNDHLKYYEIDLEQELSFTCFNNLTQNYCRIQNCPSLKPYHLDVLQKISVEACINKNAKKNPNSNITNIILNCKKKKSFLEKNMFLKYIEDIYQNQEKEKEAKNTKAHLTYLKYRPYNNPRTDYEGACGFMKNFHLKFLPLFKNNKVTHTYTYTYNDLKLLDQTIYYNFHLMSALELFQACLIKKLLRSPQL